MITLVELRGILWSILKEIYPDMQPITTSDEMKVTKAKLIRKMRSSCSDLFILNCQILYYEVRAEEAFEVPRLMQMSEECEQVLQKMDNGDGLTEQMIAEFEKSRVTQMDNALEE